MSSPCTSSTRSILSSNDSRSRRMADCSHCPNCHYPVAQPGRAEKPHHLDQIDSRNAHQNPQQATTQDVLSNPRVHEQYRYMPVSSEGQNRSKAPQKKARSLFSFSFPKRRKRSLQQEGPVRPTRPKRPSPEQCPPKVQQQRGSKEWFKSSISAPYLTAGQQADRIGSNDALDSIVLERKHTIDPSQTTFQGPLNSRTLLMAAAGYRGRGSTYSSAAVFDRFEDRPITPSKDPLLYSTPPTTASKLALKPSPLRLEQHVAPLLPPKSQSRMPFGLLTSDITYQHSLGNVPNRSSDTSERSIYSQKTYSEDTISLETPPTSPPELPRRSNSRRLMPPNSAQELAQNMREELDLINDVYRMNVKGNKYAKQRSSSVERQKEGWNSDQSRVSGVSAYNSTGENVQDAFDRIDDQLFFKAVEEAIRKSPELQDWLLSRQADADHVQQIRQNDLSKGKKSSLAFSAASASSEVLPQLLRETLSPVPQDLEEQPHASVMTSNDPSATTQVCTEPKSPVSLSKIRQKLYELSDDDGNGEVEPTLEHLDRPPASSIGTSRSSVSSIDLPLNCRRLEIELRGKRLPILIHQNGRVLEGPCTEANCSQHTARTVQEKF